ncbi:MAG TPA: cyclase family protein [Acetobacteraceae bacterium]|nr:cyclase family protein [Acetobacteraceae bacterium]
MASGAISRITADAVRKAAALAGEGRVYDLGLEINERMPQNPDFVRFSLAFTTTPEGTGATSPFQYCAEVITGALHTSTHIDALVHVQAEGRIHGGALAREARGDRGWREQGMETVPPIVGRAVLLDIARLRGADILPDGYEVTIADLRDALQASGRALAAGDIVLVRTGKIRQFYADPAAFQAAEPGVGREAALWLHDEGMAVLGTDTTGTEPLPFADPAQTTHRAMLVERGVHLIENLDLEAPARDQVSAGLFVALPLKITGATGSWVRPVLIV